MIDAYTIGIKLALEDGVSAGIASISAQLSILDRAIGDTEANLTRLADLGRRVGLASRAPEPRSDLTVKSPHLTVKRPPLPGPSAIEPDEFPVPPTARKPVRTVFPPAFGPAPADSVPESRPVPTFAKPSQRPASPIRPAPIPLHRFAEPVSPVEPAALINSVSPRYPAASRPIDRDVHIPPTGLGPAVAHESLPPLPANELVSKASAYADPLPIRSPARRTQPPETGITARRGGPPPPVPKPAASFRVADKPEPNHAAATPDAAPPNSRKQSAGHPGPESQSLAGELYLDGAHLGRWMTDSLESAVSRPPSGPTGFDPRVGPSWPGLPGD